MGTNESETACYTYMVRCADGTLYTGWTNDLQKRLTAHNSGKGAKYTASRRPVTLVYAERHEDKITAMQREYSIKRLTKDAKEALIESTQNIAD
ncbi:MAG: GIY-YIG nuclease family protein [Ruminococcus sp.]|nr:GIY-YIG nuclease family protein [Ruminococcus sp.]